MKKLSVCVIVLIQMFFASGVYAQGIPSYSNAFRIGVSATASAGKAIAKDASGNIYVTGYFAGASYADFDPADLTHVNTSAKLTSAGSNDIFVAKYNSSGVYQWAFRIGAAGSDQAFAIAVDAGGYIYITGQFGLAGGSETVNFDPAGGSGSSLTSSKNSDIFVAKYDTNGAYQWAFDIGGIYNDYGYGIAVDNSSNVYVTGGFTGTGIDFDPSSGTHSLNANSGTSAQDIFVAKYNSSGVYQWAFNVGGAGTLADYGYGIALENSGNNVYVAGYYSGAGVNFDPLAATPSHALTSRLSASGTSYSADIFVAKYSTSDATYQWARGMGGTGSDQAAAVAVDGNNNVFITGALASSGVDFDTAHANTLASTKSTLGGNDVFLAKYNSNGDYQWVLSLGSTGNSSEQGYSLSTDGSNNVFLGATIAGPTMDFDPAHANSSSIKSTIASIDIAIAKYDNNGAYQWAFNVGGAQSEIPYGMALDASNNIILTGYCYSPSVDFDPSSATNSLSNIGSSDIFIAKYKDLNKWTGATNTDWSTASNWALNAVPAGSDNAVIATAANQPVITTGITAPVGGFTMQSGTTLGIGNTASLNVTGDVYNAGIVSGAGNLQLTASYAQPVSGTGTLGNVILNNSNGAIIGSGSNIQTVTGTITPTSGTLTTNGNLVLASGSTGSASIAQGTGSYLSGNVTVQRYVGSSQQWRMIGFPFTAATTIGASTLASFYSGGYNAYTYNEGADDQSNYGNSSNANAGWTQFITGTATANNGILLAGGPSSTINLAGTVNTGTQTIALTYNKSGWNFIANPFASNISWTTVYNANSSNVSATVYRYNPNSTAYGSFNASTSSSVNNQGDVIENGAGFFVQASSAGNLSISENAKATSVATVSMMGVHNTGISTDGAGNTVTSSDAKSVIKFSLAKQGDQYSDEVVLRWGGGFAATDKFDAAYDAYDLGRKVGPDLSVVGADATQYSIFHGSELNQLSEENRTVQLGIKNMEEGNYVIGIQLQSAITGNNKAYLYDSYTGTYTLIDNNAGSYSFITTADAKSQSNNRFSVMVNPKGLAVDISNTNMPVVLLNNPSNNNQFTLFSKNVYSQLQFQLTDNAGRILQNGQFVNVQKGGAYTINAYNAGQGYYFIKLTGDGNVLPTLKALKN